MHIQKQNRHTVPVFCFFTLKKLLKFVCHQLKSWLSNLNTHSKAPSATFSSLCHSSLIYIRSCQHMKNGNATSIKKIICWCRKKDFNASISIFAPSWMIRSTGQTTLNFELVGSIPARGGSGCETTLWTWQNEFFQSNLDSFCSPFELVNYLNSYFIWNRNWNLGGGLIEAMLFMPRT